MLLAFDIGNSSIDFGLIDGDGHLLFKSKMSSEVPRSAEEYAVMISGIMKLHHLSDADVSGCMIASVVPLLTRSVERAVKFLFGVDSIEVGPGIRTGFDIKIDSQTQLGADIVSNAAGSLAEFDAPILIVDVGTATTFTIIDEKRALQGVVIATGLRMSMNALSSGASELPDASISLPKRLLGKNTKESMNSGVLYGHAYMIDGFVDKLSVKDQVVVITGGLAEQILPLIESKPIYRPDLTLQGLYSLYVKNVK